MDFFEMFTSISDIHIDIISGVVAGSVSTIVSHPLDTIKLRM